MLSGAAAGAIAFSATSDAGPAPHTFAAPTVAADHTTPATAAPAVAVPTAIAATASIAAPTATVGVAATDAAAPTLAPTASVAPTLAEAWSATPHLPTPAPDPAPSPAASQLVTAIEPGFGVSVILAGQDWGPDEAEQLRNLGALAGALASLPANLVSLATDSSHGTLSVLSNEGGRTLAGWQPYGQGAANFYATQDWDGNAHTAASQIVLQTGANRVTIAHELLHAYQMRNAPPGNYGRALLTAEMGAFMAATGWVQIVSDAELQSLVDGSWEGIAAMFRYEGANLSYVSETGEAGKAFAPNPIEAFAAVGALIYAAPDGTELPEWPEYRRWFESNLG